MKNSNIFTHNHIINFAAVEMSTQKLEGFKVFIFLLFRFQQNRKKEIPYKLVALGSAKKNKLRNFVVCYSEDRWKRMRNTFSTHTDLRHLRESLNQYFNEILGSLVYITSIFFSHFYMGV